MQPLDRGEFADLRHPERQASTVRLRDFHVEAERQRRSRKMKGAWAAVGPAAVEAQGPATLFRHEIADDIAFARPVAPNRRVPRRLEQLAHVDIAVPVQRYSQEIRTAGRTPWVFGSLVEFEPNGFPSH